MHLLSIICRPQNTQVLYTKIKDKKRKRDDEEEEENQETEEVEHEEEEKQFYILLDIECTQDTGRRQPNLLVAMTSEEDQTHSFGGESCLKDFCS